MIMRYSNFSIRNSICTICLVVFIFSGLFAQNNEKKVYKTNVKLEYLKKSDNSKRVIASLTTRIDRKLKPLANKEISLYIAQDTIVKKIETGKTDVYGKKAFLLPSFIEELKDSSGYFHISAAYKGSDSYKASKRTLDIMDVEMDVTLGFDEDSVKTISLTAYTIDNNGEEQDVEEADVYCYVKRMFGNINIGEGTIEEGTVEIGLEDDFSLPGDSNGNILNYPLILR